MTAWTLFFINSPSFFVSSEINFVIRCSEITFEIWNILFSYLSTQLWYFSMINLQVPQESLLVLFCNFVSLNFLLLLSSLALISRFRDDESNTHVPLIATKLEKLSYQLNASLFQDQSA